MSIKNQPKHIRPREKLASLGAENLTDTELLAIMLRTGSKGVSAVELAQKILKLYPIPKLSMVKYQQLVSFKGVSTTKAVTVLASIEFAKRAQNAFNSTQPIIQSPEDVIPHIQHIANHKRESFLVLYLNARNQLLHVETISIGTLTASLVHPREVFAPALELRAVSMILAHNHPSGDATPSLDDVELTQQLVEASQIMSLTIQDHIIISVQAYVSMKKLGLL